MTWATIILVVAVVLGWGYYFLAGLAARRLIHIKRVTEHTLRREGKNPKTPQSLGMDFERWEIPSFDGVVLAAWWLEGPFADAPTIVLLHGMHMSRVLFVGPAKELRDRGFHVFLPDLRAHGESGGERCTFGDLEARDLSVMLDYIAQKKGIQRFGLWGISLGGIVGLRAAAREPRIRALVVQSPYTSLTAIVALHMNRVSGLLPLLLMPALKARLKSVSGVNADKVDLLAAAAEIEIPVMFVAGDNDQEVPIAETEEVIKAARRSPDVRRLVVRGAGHNNIHKVGGEDFWQNITGFFNQYLRAQ
ncbi:MAG: alpha/beta fold hydrolase [Bacteroidia bacterium]|nr:lysophospholipase [Bacteroidia bacterium]MDW8333330.1 alpha/beta fold hydrolase [Bacteroidia bacterium]